MEWKLAEIELLAMRSGLLGAQIVCSGEMAISFEIALNSACQNGWFAGIIIMIMVSLIDAVIRLVR